MSNLFTPSYDLESLLSEIQDLRQCLQRLLRNEQEIHREDFWRVRLSLEHLIRQSEHLRVFLRKAEDWED